MDEYFEDEQLNEDLTPFVEDLTPFVVEQVVETPMYIKNEVEDISQEEPKTKVYIEINSNNEIIKIFSSVFEGPAKTSIFIDEGLGDRYRHAQSQYLEKGLISEEGNYNYKYENGKIIENKG